MIIRFLFYCNLFFLNRDRAPGQAECDEAIELINQSVRDLDNAALEAIGSNLPPMEGNNFQVRMLGFNFGASHIAGASNYSPHFDKVTGVTLLNGSVDGY